MQDGESTQLESCIYLNTESSVYICASLAGFPSLVINMILNQNINLIEATQQR